MLSAIDHIGVAVPSIDAALGFYRDAMQMELVHRETVVDQGVKAALLDVGDSHVELIEPLSPDTGVGRFLHKHGGGLHHVASFILVAMGPSPQERYPDPAHHLPRPLNNHLSYAITWYGLAVALVVIFVLWARKALDA